MRAYIAPRVFTAADGDDAVLEDAAVVISSSGRIRAVGAAGEVVPDDAERVEVDGVLLPGLIDVHTHVCLSAGDDPAADCAADPVARVAIRAAHNLALQLDAGVTTIRDVGGVHGVDLELARMLRDDLIEGPDMLAAGNVLCMTGGHACFMGLECDSPDAFRFAARKVIKDGADLVKLIATGGVITRGVRPGAQQLSVEEMRAACEVAHRAERTVAAHAQGAEGIEAALEAGVNTIEHGFWLTDRAIATMVERGRTLVPTFAALRAMQRDRAQLPQFIADKLDEVEGPQRDSFLRAWKAGVFLATGTDAGTPGNPHGRIHDELAAFAELGVPALDCWRAATSWAARACALEDRGVLRAGARGDLIVIAPEELELVQSFRRPRLVVQRGEIVRGGA
jgi:imidazolonepropionase-like amidohydrolase